MGLISTRSAASHEQQPGWADRFAEAVTSSSRSTLWTQSVVSINVNKNPILPFSVPPRAYTSHRFE